MSVTTLAAPPRGEHSAGILPTISSQQRLRLTARDLVARAAILIRVDGHNRSDVTYGSPGQGWTLVGAIYQAAEFWSGETGLVNPVECYGHRRQGDRLRVACDNQVCERPLWNQCGLAIQCTAEVLVTPRRRPGEPTPEALRLPPNLAWRTVVEHNPLLTRFMAEAVLCRVKISIDATERRQAVERAARRADIECGVDPDAGRAQAEQVAARAAKCADEGAAKHVRVAIATLRRAERAAEHEAGLTRRRIRAEQAAARADDRAADRAARRAEATAGAPR